MLRSERESQGSGWLWCESVGFHVLKVNSVFFGLSNIQRQTTFGARNCSGKIVYMSTCRIFLRLGIFLALLSFFPSFLFCIVVVVVCVLYVVGRRAVCLSLPKVKACWSSGLYNGLCQGSRLLVLAEFVA